jgi:hypothetical protein
MKRLRVVIGAIAVLVLVGCAAAHRSTSSHGTAVRGRASTRGTVTGRLLLEGGPLGPGGQQPGARPIPGSVRFAGGPGRAVQVRVGHSGTFSVRLRSGTYHVSGRSPAVIQVSNGAVIGAKGQLVSGSKHELSCSEPLSVTVTARQPARITVTCIVP